VGVVDVGMVPVAASLRGIVHGLFMRRGSWRRGPPYDWQPPPIIARPAGMARRPACG